MPATAHLSIIGVFNPRTGQVELYELLVLPFGSTAAVYHFNWVARALWTIMTSIFLIFCTQLFDDFPALESPELA